MAKKESNWLRFKSGNFMYLRHKCDGSFEIGLDDFYCMNISVEDARELAEYLTKHIEGNGTRGPLEED